jgi:hypothetical protein
MKNLTAKEVIERNIDFARKRSERFSISVYAPITSNIYFDGHSYRVRVTRDYNRTSVNFPKMKDALKFRDRLLK